MKRFILIVGALCLAVACFAAENLSTQTGTVNLSAGTPVTVGTFTSAAEGAVFVRFNLSTMNGAAATLTPNLQVLNSSGTVLLDTIFSEPKAVSTNTYYGSIFAPVPVHNGEKLRLQVADTNASDTSVSWSMDVFDATYAGGAIPTLAFGTTGGLTESGSNGSISLISGHVDAKAQGGTIDTAASATAIAAGGIGSGAFTSNAFGSQGVGSVLGSVASVVGAVGSVTARVTTGGGTIDTVAGSVGTLSSPTLGNGSILTTGGTLNLSGGACTGRWRHSGYRDYRREPDQSANRPNSGAISRRNGQQQHETGVDCHYNPPQRYRNGYRRRGIDDHPANRAGSTNSCVGCLIKITSGTGSGQARYIGGYVNSTHVLTTTYPWLIAPDNTSVYEIDYADDAVRVRGQHN